jgi:prolyl oligopeptidase family protein
MKSTAPRLYFFHWKLSFYALLIISFATASVSLAPFAGAQNPNPSASAMDGGAKPPTKVVYPESKKVEVVDDYHGTKVADPYRWLEDEKTEEVSA